MSSTGPGCEIAKTELGCPRDGSTPAHFLMCRPHWAQVSRPAQQLVYAALRGEGPLGEGYKQAVKDAVDEVLARDA